MNWNVFARELLRRQYLRAQYRYEDYWSPENEDEAMKLIIEPHVSWDEFERSGQRDAQRIKELLPDKNSSILDFGCGIGRVLKYLLDYHKVYGVDISRRMLGIAQSRLAACNVVLLHTKNCALPLPDESIDLVYSLLTLQHLDRSDVTKVVSEFRRVLRYGGKCYLQFPCYGDGELGRDTRPWTEECVREWLKDFKELSLERIPSTPLGDPSWANMYALFQKDELGVGALVK